MSEHEIDMMHHEEGSTAEKLRKHLESKDWRGKKLNQGRLLLNEYDALATRRDYLRSNKSLNQKWLDKLAELVVDFKSHSIKIDAAAEALLIAIANVAVETKSIEGKAKDNISNVLELLLEAYEESMERLI